MGFQDPLGSAGEGDGQMEVGHLSVLAEEVVTILSPRPGSLQIDGTLGGGGHTERILEASRPDGRVLGLDADPAAIERVRERLARFGDRLVLRNADFRDVGTIAQAAGFAAVDGFLLDLGLSSFQLADTERGFGFRAGGPLDMRFDPTRGIPASELVATLDTTALADIFRRYGEEPRADRIARAIVRERAISPVDTAERLASIVERAAPAAPGRRRIHPATRVFQALRIAVNDELGALEAALAAAMDLLRPGGRLVVLSYHSLEDRIVKRFVATERKGCICPPELPVCACGRVPRLRAVGPQPVMSGPDEVLSNPRARSVRMRAAERLAA